jgi:DNA-binding MarR family transcriptional regulator
MDQEKELAIHELVQAIRKLVSTVHLSSSKMKKQYGLTGPQVEALRILYKEGTLSSAELSRKLFVTPSNITGIIDRLEKKELVNRIRNPYDRRISLLELTDHGEAMSASLPTPLETRLVENLLDMEVDEIKKIAHQLHKILGIVSQVNGVDMSQAVQE